MSGGKKVLLKNGVETTGHPQSEKVNLDPVLISVTRVNSKWVTGLNLKGNTLKVENNIRENLNDHVFDSILDVKMKA